MKLSASNFVLLKLRRFYSLALAFGFDPRQFLLSLAGLPHYFLDLVRFQSNYRGKLRLQPCLSDRWGQAGSISNEYFWQDLIVAQWIFIDNPIHHVDIGSRIDGFVAHIASFRDVEVFDVRPLSLSIPRVKFRCIDIMEYSDMERLREDPASEGYCDSLSCLHALEHFGLGRYGDPINVNGFMDGLKNMSSLLRPNGRFYLAVPVGRCRVEFNANRIFDPVEILQLASKCNLSATKLTIIAGGKVFCGVDQDQILSRLEAIAGDEYSLAIFCFVKANE